MNDAYDSEVTLKLLKLLKHNPELTQRQMNTEMGVSLGKINCCISGLAKQGLIKIERFNNPEKKLRYIYHPTPEGLAEITRLTFRFLNMRIKEYKKIKEEIKYLSEQMCEIDLDLYNAPGLMEELKKIQS